MISNLKNPALLVRAGLSLVIGGILCFCYFHFFVFRAQLEVDIQAFSPDTTHLKVYWSDERGVYTEKESRRRKVNPQFGEHRFFVTDLADIHTLRIDPIEHVGKARIKRIALTQPGYQRLELTSADDFKGLEIRQHIQSAAFDGEGWMLDIDGPDSQLVLDTQRLEYSGLPFRFWVYGFLVFFGGVWLMMMLLKSRLFDDFSYVPAGLLVALVFAIMMAATTSFNVHPDEKAHFRALNYYTEHILPPALDKPELAYTFSDYGRSRLGDFELYYPLSGFFSRMMEPFRLSGLLNARMFGLLLLLMLTLLAFRNETYRSLTLPFLITPQAWYLFSYANSDSFSLFITVIASYQAVSKQSLLYRFLTDVKPTRFAIKAAALGALIGALLLLKENYYSFILFLVGYLGWRLWSGDFPERKRLWLRVTLLALVGVLIYGLRLGWDFYVNGPNPAQTRAQLAEKYALEMYKPSTPLEDKHIYLYLKERGVPLKQLLGENQWGWKTFGSSFGIYGYTQYLADDAYYYGIAIIGGLLLLVMLISVLVHGPPNSWFLIGMALACVCLLILISLMASWVQVFQAQGRYLAPALPMFGIMIYHIRAYLFKPLVNILVLTLFVFATYSFLFVGLHDIEKSFWILG